LAQPGENISVVAILEDESSMVLAEKKKIAQNLQINSFNAEGYLLRNME